MIDSILNLRAGGAASLALLVGAGSTVEVLGDVEMLGDIRVEAENYYYVGNELDGSVLVDDGAVWDVMKLTLSDGHEVDGSLKIDGVGSVVNAVEGVVIGGGTSSAKGLLEVVNGGRLNAAGILTGEKSYSKAELVVAGQGSSVVTVGSLLAGYEKSDTAVSIVSGGSLETNGGYLGYRLGSAVVVVDGADSSWLNGGDFYVGHKFGNNELRISGGAHVKGESAYVGYEANATGAVEVVGQGSNWDLSGNLYVGYNSRREGQRLSVSNGANVNVEGQTWVGHLEEWGGVIEFDSGVLNTSGLLAASDTLLGNGEINTNGLVTDLELVFDSSSGLKQTLVLNDNSLGQDIVINLDADGSGAMGAGYGGYGSILVTDGVSLKSSESYLGYYFDSTGVGVVEGEGSEWHTGNFVVGNKGSAYLNIENGGRVVSGDVVVGESYVVVDGGVWDIDGELRFEDFSQIETDNPIAILNGGKVFSRETFLSQSERHVGGDFLVDGVGSEWVIDGELEVYAVSVRVENGAKLRSGSTVTRGWSSYGGPSDLASIRIEGLDSFWEIEGDLTLEQLTLLEVLNGGVVSVFGEMRSNSGDSNKVYLDSGILNVGSFWRMLNHLEGNGVVNAKGLYSSIDLVFDAEHGLSQQFIVDTLEGSIELNLEVDGSGALGVGSGEQDQVFIIRDGRFVQSTEGYLGDDSFSGDIDAVIEGERSGWEVLGDLYLGGRGNTVLEVKNEAVLNIGGNLFLGTGYGDHLLSIDGGRVYVSDEIDFESGRIDLLDGSLDLGAGEIEIGSSSLNFKGGALSNVGVINVRSTWPWWPDSFVQDGGVFVIGEKRGELVGLTRINGGYQITSSDAILAIDLTGNDLVAGEDFDQLIVSDVASLQGVLDLNFIAGQFDAGLAYGLMWEVLKAGNLEGVFDQIQGVVAFEDVALAVTYSDTSVWVTSALFGDANLDGQVSLLDLDILGRNYGQKGTWADGDYNGDGMVTLLDLDILGRYYGEGYSAFLRDYRLLNIPEPSAVACLGLSVLCGLKRRRAGMGSAA